MSSKNEFSFLFPAAKAIRRQEHFLEIQNLCFPLEITKKYDFLFDAFKIRNKNRGLEVIGQEKKALHAEGYEIESSRNRITLWANSPRGQFYALSTLLQILAFHMPDGRMPGFFIRDAPDLPWRGFRLDAAHGAFPLLPELRRLLVKLALLRFNLFVISLGNPGSPGAEKSRVLDEVSQVAILAQKMGMEMFPAITIGREFSQFVKTVRADEWHAAIMASFRSPWLLIEFGENDETAAAAVNFAHLADAYRFFSSLGKKLLVRADGFLAAPELIRKIPQDVFVLNRGETIEKSDAFRQKAGPFKKHHLTQVLGTAAWSGDRFIPAMRRSMANNAAAYAAAREEKLAGVVMAGGTEKGEGGFLEGIALPLFHAGNLFWSGQAPRPDAFARWALGHDEPDLFRIYTFLSQVDNPLQRTQREYLFEDPLLANFSRQDNQREIVSTYRKASLYLKKRKIARNEMSDFLSFAQHLYEFIAAKIEFSSRLLSRLGPDGADEKIPLDADRLIAEAERLKNLYINLWLVRCQPEGLARHIREFALLQERFRYLQRASAQPAARKNLLLEFGNYSPASGPGALERPDVF
ncbi:MAG: hypothetical protein NTW95_08970 [Candidatus Aminicenantes bacterium]|nr:hypothetical protein [Candidatus Aminicenantes bacterium]